MKKVEKIEGGFMKIFKLKRKTKILLLSVSLLFKLVSPFITVLSVNAESMPNIATNSETIVWQGTWGTAPVSIDNNGVLSVGAGNVSGRLSDLVDANIRNSVKQISFTAPVVFPNDSSYLFSSLYGMYNPWISLQTITGLAYANTSNVTTMEGMFMFLNTVKTLDVSSFDTSNVKNMYYMFGNMTSLESIDISNFNTSNVNNMFCMFAQDSSLKSLDLSSFDTRNVSDMRGMLGTIKGVGGLQKITLGSNFSFSQIGDWDASIREIKEMQGYDSSKYTGYWQNIGTGTAEHPNGLHILNSDELMKSYNGNTMADTYVWQPKSSEAAPVTVKYVDEQGNSISDNVVLTGNVGDNYTTEQKEITGYTFKEVQGNPTG
ncbi:MAG: BspA family leucine-rich repeat surface protein, partial [Enterococcus faecalis]|nr:BspA family leucine-rich repeat surface protein [Enterococcus faecalis]